jgi:hypothetical protein
VDWIRRKELGVGLAPARKSLGKDDTGVGEGGETDGSSGEKLRDLGRGSNSSEEELVGGHGHAQTWGTADGEMAGSLSSFAD